MAVRSCRVAVLVLLLLALVASLPPCAAAARVLLPADVVPRTAAGEAQGNGDRTDGSAAAAVPAGSGFRGSPPGFGGRRTAAAAGNAARVMGSVPSPGVGH